MFSQLRSLRFYRHMGVMTTSVALLAIALLATSPAYAAPQSGGGGKVSATVMASPNPAPAWQADGVHLTGSGYAPNAFVLVQFCISRDNCYGASSYTNGAGDMDFWARTGAPGDYKVGAYQWGSGTRMRKVASLDGPLYVR